ncbi:MAG: 5-formyltetrahydrofolate cyclo-ligase [Oscillospiraceae bacterium]
MLITDKKALRKHFKQVRKTMTLHQRRVCDIEIFNKVINLKEYKNSKEILLYVSSEIEVDTYMLADYSFKTGKNVLVPRCLPDSNDMEFYHINDFSDLEKGAFGIFEPKEYCTEIKNFENPICIVPALSYDERGYRLGFGKGFYDKYLAEFHGIKLGICYENCMSRQLPFDEYDVSADIVVTDKSVLNIYTA